MSLRGKTFGPSRLVAVLAAVVLAGAASTSFAQNAPPGGNGGNAGGNQGAAGGGGRGNRRDPAQMRQQMNDRMKELLGANDEEWKLLQPQIEKVQTLQRATSSRVGASLLYGNGNNGGGGGGRFRGGQQPDSAPPSAVEEKSKELAAAIQNKDTKPDEYKAKLAAFREARNQAKADLGKAQESLREVVTVRQEAVLVELGLLD
jgi:Spy/CpxP family protein refolding chaperone